MCISLENAREPNYWRHPEHTLGEAKQFVREAFADHKSRSMTVLLRNGAHAGYLPEQIRGAVIILHEDNVLRWEMFGDGRIHRGKEWK